MIKQLATLSVIATITLFSACSTTSKSADIRDAETQWQSGQNRIDEGQNAMAKAEKRIRKASEQVREGEAVVQEGELRIERLRSEYARQAGLIGSAVTYKQIDQEGRRLRKLAERWDESLDKIEDGRDEVKQGRKNLAKAQEDLQSAQAKISKGERLVANELNRRTL